MGLGSVLNTAASGLAATQAGLDIIARNIANADTPGYTRKILSTAESVTGGVGNGVQLNGVERVADNFLSVRLRAESAKFAATDVRRNFLEQLGAAFGAPGAPNALDTIFNRFGAALEALAASPEDFSARASVVSDAQGLAVALRDLSAQVQSLRQLAEDSIDTAVSDINGLLQGLEQINQQLRASGGRDVADLLDRRDANLLALSEHIDIRVAEQADGTVTVATQNGVQLLGGEAARLDFDRSANIDAKSLWSADPAERGVGAITLTGGGAPIDLIATGSLREGGLGALVKLRDETLVEAQAQLDELAHGLALALSTREAEGTPASAGGLDGFDIDLADLAPGDRVTLTYTETPPGAERTVTIVRVDDASQLPLSPDDTPEADDLVIGVDFSGGVAAAAADIQSALGPNFTVSNPAGATLRILDDGAAATIDITSLDARIAATSLQDEGVALPLFVDAGRNPSTYSASFDGGSQKLGFAARIAVNADIAADPELLVRYQSAPETPLGDVTRPLALIDRLNAVTQFAPEAGLGSAGLPFEASIGGFVRGVVAFQAGAAARAEAAHESQSVVTVALADRMAARTGVDVNTELAQLIALQNAFAANARVMQTASDLMSMLFEI
jgi:flagellar hook-associated protein 1 FlgK